MRRSHAGLQQRRSASTERVKKTICWSHSWAWIGHPPPSSLPHTNTLKGARLPCNTCRNENTKGASYFPIKDDLCMNTRVMFTSISNHISTVAEGKTQQAQSTWADFITDVCEAVHHVMATPLKTVITLYRVALCLSVVSSVGCYFLQRKLSLRSFLLFVLNCGKILYCIYTLIMSRNTSYTLRGGDI